MRWHGRLTWLMLSIGLISAGCGRNPFLSPQQQTAIQQQQTTYLSQVQELQRRVTELDTSNQDLHTQLAQSQQQLKIQQDQTTLLRNQLRDTVDQLRDTQLARQDAEKRVNVLQASTQRRGGATITANSSVRKSLAAIDIPGVEIRQEQDVIRIELPADQLFQPHTNQLVSTAHTRLDMVANAILQNYPRQRIAIEGHTDSVPAFGGIATTNHQLSTQQALAIFDQLTRRNRLPALQLSILGLGSNHPRASNATEQGRAMNRRIELVIYPETFE
jgi:flagellar motor protein MotB